MPEPTCSSLFFGCVCWVGSIGTRIPRWFTAPKLWKIVLPFNMHVKTWNPSLLLLTNNPSRSPTNDHGMIMDPRITSILLYSVETFPAKLPWLVRTTLTLLLCSSFCRETVHSTIYPPAQDSKKNTVFSRRYTASNASCSDLWICGDTLRSAVRRQDSSWSKEKPVWLRPSTLGPSIFRGYLSFQGGIWWKCMIFIEVSWMMSVSTG